MVYSYDIGLRPIKQKTGVIGTDEVGVPFWIPTFFTPKTAIPVSHILYLKIICDPFFTSTNTPPTHKIFLRCRLS